MHRLPTSFNHSGCSSLVFNPTYKPLVVILAITLAIYQRYLISRQFPSVDVIAPGFNGERRQRQWRHQRTRHLCFLRGHGGEFPGRCVQQDRGKATVQPQLHHTHQRQWRELIGADPSVRRAEYVMPRHCPHVNMLTKSQVLAISGVSLDAIATLLCLLYVSEY